MRALESSAADERAQGVASVKLMESQLNALRRTTARQEDEIKHLRGTQGATQKEIERSKAEQQAFLMRSLAAQEDEIVALQASLQKQTDLAAGQTAEVERLRGIESELRKQFQARHPHQCENL